MRWKRNSERPELIHAFWNAICDTSVLDPTCDSPNGMAGLSSMSIKANCIRELPIGRSVWI